MNPEQLQNSNNLLTSGQRKLLQAIKSAESPHGQRASALLALDEGLSLTEAASRSGLTARQVRYWRDRFQVKGMDIFPTELITPTEAEEQPVSEEPKELDEKKAKKSKKDKKSKKTKGKKMTKKKGKDKKKNKKSKKGKKGKK